MSERELFFSPLPATQEKYEKELSNLREQLKLKSEGEAESGSQSPAGSRDSRSVLG